MLLGSTLHKPHTVLEDGAASTCRFCECLGGDSELGELWTVVHETENLVVVPSVGPLIPGWVLVIPKWHVLSFGAIPTHARASLLAEVESIATWWQDAVGPLTWFEHGPSFTESCVGCSVDHAHLHLIPTAGIDLLAGAKQVLPWLTFREVPGLETAAAPLATGTPYLYLRTELGRSWLAATGAIPSQAFRRVIAHQQGRSHEYNWKVYPQMDTLSETLAMVPRVLVPT